MDQKKNKSKHTRTDTDQCTSPTKRLRNSLPNDMKGQGMTKRNKLPKVIPSLASFSTLHENQERSKQKRRYDALERDKDTKQSECINLLICNPLEKEVLSELPVKSCLTEGSEVKNDVPGICAGKGGEAEQTCMMHHLAQTVDACQNLEVSCRRPSLNERIFCTTAESDGKPVCEDVNSKVINPMEFHDDHVRVVNVPSETKILITYKRRKRIKIYSRRRKSVFDSPAVTSKSIQKDTDSLQLFADNGIGFNSLDQSAEALASGGSKHVNGKDCVHPVGKESQFAMAGSLSPLPDLCVSTVGTVQLIKDVDLLSQERHLTQNSRKKLLVLDVNGLLADIVFNVPHNYTPDTIISRKAVFKRPYCDDFLQFCFTHFNVGIWSSRTKRNVELILDFLLGNAKHKLLFCWDQSHCTQTGHSTLENKHKPIILKKLKKLWEKCEPDLPWERGEYNESNTLLLDDSPYKALCNPPHTAIFPQSYRYTDDEDKSLGPGGDLRVYLEGLAMAEDVQKYVQENPFGQQPITKESISWHYYLEVMEAGLSSPEHTLTDIQVFPRHEIDK